MNFLSHINSLLLVIIFIIAALNDTFVDMFFPFLNEIVILSFVCLIIINFNRFKYDFGAILLIIPTVVFCVLSVISADDLHIGGYNTAAFIILILILFSIHGIKFNVKLINNLLLLFSIGVLGGSFYFILNSYSDLLGFDEASGIFINSNSFGMYLGFMITFAVLSFKDSIYKWVYVATLLPFLLYSNSRGSLMFVLIFFLVYFIKSSRSVNRLTLYSIILAGGVAILLITFNTFYLDSDIKILNKIQSSGSSGRFDIWMKIIKNMLKDTVHVLFGSGPSTTFIDGKSAHNSFINESSNMGIFFVMFYSLLMVYKYIKFHLLKYQDFTLIVIPILFLGLVESILFINSLFWLLLLFVNLKFKSEKISIE